MVRVRGQPEPSHLIRQSMEKGGHNDERFYQVLQHGSLFMPADAAYGSDTALGVGCDRCDRFALPACVHFESLDLCLQCCDSLANALYGVLDPRTMLGLTVEEVRAKHPLVTVRATMRRHEDGRETIVPGGNTEDLRLKRYNVLIDTSDKIVKVFGMG